MTELIPSSESLSKIDHRQLQSVSAESLWLANFTSLNTRESYRRAVAKFTVDMGITSSDALYSVTQAHVVAWREHLRSEGMSNASVSQHLSALSSMYKVLTDKQLCAFNPVSGVLRPNERGKGGVGSGKTPALTSRQVHRLLQAPLSLYEVRKPSELQRLRDHAVLALYLYTGARCSEPGKLKVKDLMLDRGYWVVRMKIKGEKTNIVAIAEEDDQDNECLNAIRDYLDFSGHGSDANAPLFRAVKHGRNTGEPLSRIAFYNLFKKYVRLAGLPDTITPHSARSTFITQAYELGMMGEDIQRTVGHSSITTTEAYNQSKRRLRKSASLGLRY
ncbi:MAG: tyrosine-type recombinase/integrase [Gammaproteobacteria bacterium]|nr:tyrosine-type recombinase/integrase [Gammaproteobacteria bacterium]